MSHGLEIILYRSISQDHPCWSREQIARAAREATEGRGPYAQLLTDLQAAAGE